MPDATTVGGLAAGILGGSLMILGRWVAHLAGRVNELRERVARLEGRQDEEDR